MANTRLGMVARSAMGAGLALAVMVLAAVSPAMAAPAPNNCDGTGTIAVQLLALQSAQNATMMAQTDGSYTRTIRVRVFCNGDQDPPNDIGEVINAQIAFWIDLTGKDVDPNLEIYVGEKSATNAGEPVLVDAPDGFADVKLRSSDPDILDLANGQWRAKLGTSNTIVTRAFGADISSDDSPGLSGNLWAQTPELGSLALFGAGAAGMAGYALTRLRSGFGRRGRRE
jgi:hypothetical protein